VSSSYSIRGIAPLQFIGYCATKIMQWGITMDSRPANPRVQFKDFSDLYRAALAERDPDTKGMLLREVQRAIDDREQSYEVLPRATA
jgi:hypothetical protein